MFNEQALPCPPTDRMIDVRGSGWVFPFLVPMFVRSKMSSFQQQRCVWAHDSSLIRLYLLEKSTKHEGEDKNKIKKNSSELKQTFPVSPVYHVIASTMTIYGKCNALHGTAAADELLAFEPDMNQHKHIVFDSWKIELGS